MQAQASPSPERSPGAPTPPGDAVTPAPERYSRGFLIITALFVTTLIVSNLIAVKLIDVAGLIMPAGVIIFPVSYIVGDVLTEVYGYARARTVIWLGFGCNLLAVLAIAVAGALPAAGFWEGQAAWNLILGYAPRLLAASFLAYLVGELANAYVLARMKVATEGRHLWARTIGSTLVGQGLDSAIFILIAFWGTIPSAGLVAAILTQWLVKSGYEALATPLTYAVTGFLKRSEGIDAFDRDTDFRPLAWLGQRAR
ncbi:MAG: queuosine precursor transporter [Caldilineae bacterium]|nr:queuosine precursor transporter [Caldilineae bacterium]